MYSIEVIILRYIKKQKNEIQIVKKRGTGLTKTEKASLNQ